MLKIIIQKFLTVLRTIRTPIRFIIRSFREWYEQRRIVKNWFYLFIYSIYTKLSYNSVNEKSILIKACFSPAIIMYFPVADLKRFGALFAVTIADVCFNGFKKFFGKEIFLNEDDVVIDIGAHLGRFCLPTFFGHPNLRIFAYEPDLTNYYCLLRSVSENHFDKSRFIVENLAIFNKNGETTFSIGPESSQGSLSEIGFFLDNQDSNRISVKTKTLETIFDENQIDQCKLLKVDCEGSEYAIFLNLSKVILHKIENIYMELHPIIDNNPETLKQFLRENGFDIKEVSRDDGCCEVFCMRRP